MREDLLKGLTEEQVKRVKACKNSEELLAAAKEEGIELTDEQLNAISGGCGKSKEWYEIVNHFTQIYHNYFFYFFFIFLSKQHLQNK